MKPSLQTRLGQQLTLTPQLRQAIRLLQLSAIELEAEVVAAVESNPLLDRVEQDESEETASDGSSDLGVGNGAGDSDGNGNGADEHIGDVSPVEAEGFDEPGLDFEPDWYESAAPSGPGPAPEDGEFAESAAEPEDLHDHLLWQLHLTSLSTRDRAIGVSLIEAIGEDGYLAEPLEDIQASLKPEIDAGLEEIGAVLQRIQRFDPVGVGARDLAECLSIQLSLCADDTPGLVLARRLLEGHLEALARLGPERLAGELNEPVPAMTDAVALLRSLDPRPGAQISSGAPEYVSPDCVTWRQHGVWKVSLAPGSQPRLAINRHYERLIAKAARADASYLRGQLQEARWLIKSLETRADTLLRVARSIVRQQSGFLEHGPEAMRPLTLREVAEELGLHESTISRATARKYLLTPRGTFEFRHFFASGIVTDGGGAASSTAIQAMIRKLVGKEDPRRPLSDAKLADELKSVGVPVARRTVAKYREAMNIPASNERQRLG